MAYAHSSAKVTRFGNESLPKRVTFQGGIIYYTVEAVEHPIVISDTKTKLLKLTQENSKILPFFGCGRFDGNVRGDILNHLTSFERRALANG